jgi:hypothetical protein
VVFKEQWNEAYFAIATRYNAEKIIWDMGACISLGDKGAW